jgi:hypothetical protein
VTDLDVETQVVAVDLPTLAAEVKRYHADAQTAQRNMVESAVRSGQALLAAKAQCKAQHKKWMPWVADNFDFSHDLAVKYMRLAKNSERVLILDPNTSLREALHAIDYRLVFSRYLDDRELAAKQQELAAKHGHVKPEPKDEPLADVINLPLPPALPEPKLPPKSDAQQQSEYLNEYAWVLGNLTRAVENMTTLTFAKRTKFAASRKVINRDHSTELASIARKLGKVEDAIAFPNQRNGIRVQVGGLTRRFTDAELDDGTVLTWLNQQRATVTAGDDEEQSPEKGTTE